MTAAAALFRVDGGEVDRGRSIDFSFDGNLFQGFAGDTLASALLASGVRLFGRSFKYHRPRGLLSAGVDEPNALVGVGIGGRFEPNVRASDLFIYEGLCAISQNRWPSLERDFAAANQLIAPFIPAGFYYKTFFGGPKLWKLYERGIRRAAGLGAAPTMPDPDLYERRAVFCDVLIVGSGPSGLAAARAAASAGAKVLLVEQDPQLGGSLRRDAAHVMGRDPNGFADATRELIEAAGGRVLRRATAAGVFDHGMVMVVERRVEAGAAPAEGAAAQRLWRVRAKELILATGALERPLLFAGNDRPGVMLSSAVRTYIRRFGVVPGRRAVIATNTDDAYLTAIALADAGCEIAGILDARPMTLSPAVAEANRRFPVRFSARVRSAVGGVAGLREVVFVAGGAQSRIAADLLAVSGGFSPVVHLHMHAGGALKWDERLGSFVPSPHQRRASVGAAGGKDGLSDSLADGWRAGIEASERLGLKTSHLSPPAIEHSGLDASAAGGLLGLTPGATPKTSFLDLQNDVTVADADLAWREGYRSVEHLKRYTTLGMATDQGKTSNLLALGRLSENAERPVPTLGITTFRPPYTPVALGALAGDAVAGRAAPIRRLPLSTLHEEAGALWQPSGHWMRPRAFPKGAEALSAAAMREAQSVRGAAGVTDVSSLAKFDVAGPDAGAFLERVCATRVAHLKPGRGRYTFMLREDGLVFDDGTVWRIAQDRFLMTSSTGGAERMAAHIAYVKDVLSRDLRVAVLDVQDHWAGVAFAGPRAASALERMLGLSPPKHMGALRAALGGVQVLILAASYSGERAFEIYARSFEIASVWRVLRAAAEDIGGCAYGLEALELLRIEKGHIEVGAEIDGRRTAGDVGLAGQLNPAGGYVGAAGAARAAFALGGRQTLVGLEASAPIPEGAMLIKRAGEAPEGHVSSAGLRTNGQGAVALGLLKNGGVRGGELILASSPTRGRTVEVRVVSPHHYDPAGGRYRA